MPGTQRNRSRGSRGEGRQEVLKAEDESEGSEPVSRSWGSTPCETGAFAMSDKPISPLRQRMIDDMTARRFSEKVQKAYVRHVRTFAAFLGRLDSNQRYLSPYCLPRSQRLPYHQNRPQ